MKTDGTTKSYGIIGWPVKHSLSPVFQARFIEQAGLNAVYLPFPVAPDLLTQAMDGLWALGIEGFNVTVPHKESVFRMVSSDASARTIGAVNTVRRGADGWQATNTDWLGFKSVVEGLATDIRGKQVLLFGAGGTSRAVLHALNALQPATLFICNRNPERLAGLIAAARKAWPDLHCQPLAWQQEAVTAAASESVLLINTTSIGLQPDAVFPFELAGSGVAIDAVYRPDGKPAFVQAAAMSGRESVDGLPMLIAQGAAAFAWWHDCDAPDCSETLTMMQRRLGRVESALAGWRQSR